MEPPMERHHLLVIVLGNIRDNMSKVIILVHLRVLEEV
jgi:hypothetical protein